MAEPIRRIISAIFDRASAEKVEGQLVASLESAGKKGGENFLRELRGQFNQRIAKLREELAAGLIDERAFRRESEAAARAFNDGLLANIRAARAEGKLADGEYIKLARNFKRVGEAGATAWDFIKGSIIGAGSALAAYFGARQLAGFARSSIDAAIEADAIWNQLAGTLEGVGVEFADVEAELLAVQQAMADTTTMGDEEFAQTLQNLVLVTGDYATALENVALVADLAAAKNLSFDQASEMVGKALAGNTLALTKMFPTLKDSTDIIGDLTRMLDGQAEVARGAWAGAITTLSKEWGNLKEEIGKALIEAGGGTSILETLIGTVKGLTAWVAKNQEGIQLWVGTGLKVAIMTLQALWGVTSSVVNLFRGGLQIAVGVLTVSFGGLAKGAALAIRGISKFNDLIGRDNAAEKWNDYADSIDNVADALIRAADASVGRGFGSLGRAFGIGNAEGQSPSNRPATPTGNGGGGTGGGDPLALPGVSNVREREASFQVSSTGDGGLRQTGLNLTPVVIPPGKEIPEWQAAMWSMANSGEAVAGHLEDSFQNLFTAISNGFDESETGFHSWGDAALGVGASVAAGLADGLGDYYRAHGAAKIAESIWPVNPLGLASGGAMIAAAGALDVIAGSASHAGISKGVRPVTGAPREVGRYASDNATRPSSEVNLYINPWDPQHPGMQDGVKQAFDFATERWGDSKITVKPYPTMRQ